MLLIIRVLHRTVLLKIQLDKNSVRAKIAHTDLVKKKLYTVRRF